MWIKRQVVMLPTNEKTPVTHQGIIQQGDTLLYFKEKIFISKDVPRIGQRLYILSDEEIKEGDWFIWLKYNTIHKATKSDDNKECKKIIATTDESLTIDVIPTGFKSGVGALSHKQTINLPKPSQQFIEKYVEEYNKGNIITDVMVKYEEAYGYHIDIPANEREYKLKINPKDNTITIHRVKDSWNREELIIILNKFHSDLVAGKINRLNDNWIEKNL